jgi:murein tripeptide amidase MpaA
MTRASLCRAGLIAVLSVMIIGRCRNGDDPTTPPNAGLYHTFSEVATELHALAAAHPDLARVESIGRSVEGRDLWAIKLTDNVSVNESEPVVVFLGGHHAREWIAVDVPFLLAKHLIENYNRETQITQRLNAAEIWIVPMVNPDGHQYSVTTSRLWRKNRRNNGDGTFGVDLNRNYSYQWGGSGSSGDTFSEIYRGPSPFSEPETQAARDFLLAKRPKALISYHSFSQLVLYPWGYTNTPAPDQPRLHTLAVAMADAIRAVHGVAYTPQQSADLYLASGDTTDWLYFEIGVPAYTIELRPRTTIPGFELPENEIAPTFEENLPAALYLIDQAIAAPAMAMN